MKKLIFLLVLAIPAFSQQATRWFATTGDMTLSAASTATVQQVATTNSQLVTLDQAVVYCSVACNITQAANGAAATSTAGTVTPILPAQLNAPIPITFWTTSNVGTGTAQGGIMHLPAGSTVVLCLSKSCGNAADVTLGNGGTATNYSITIGSISGTANITFYGRVTL